MNELNGLWYSFLYSIRLRHSDITDGDYAKTTLSIGNTRSTSPCLGEDLRRRWRLMSGFAPQTRVVVHQHAVAQMLWIQDLHSQREGNSHAGSKQW